MDRSLIELNNPNNEDSSVIETMRASGKKSDSENLESEQLSPDCTK